jgi:hypothetical protein
MEAGIVKGEGKSLEAPGGIMVSFCTPYFLQTLALQEQKSGYTATTA